MKEQVKNSTLIVIDNADHIVVLNHVDKVAGAIEQFVDQTTSMQLVR